MVIEHGDDARSVRQPIWRSLLLALGLIALAAQCSAVEFAGGTGEPNDPYLIATAGQLLAADFSKAGVHFRLSGDIDLNRQTVRPGYFRAHLDGAGFEICSAMIIGSTSFLGTIEPEGTITNLTLADLDLGLAVWAPEVVNPWIRDMIGAMAGENYGTITNCAVTGWVVVHWGKAVGGLVGFNKGSIANCYFDGWVSTDGKTTEGETLVGDEAYVGGLVSCNYGTIANSFAHAIVVGTEGVGGLVGYNGGTIRNCYSWGMVLGETGSGGLVAENHGSLRRCYTISSVAGSLRGGLVGMARWSGGTASDCLWNRRTTSCKTSGAGVEIDFFHPFDYAYNGWAGDPNWVIPHDPFNYPRLAWEGVDGDVVPDPALWGGGPGSGTESDPYVITQASSLTYLCTRSVLWNAHFVLGADIDMASETDFSPIGVGPGSSFSGKFNGNGHVIRNVRIGFEEATAWNLGVFGHVAGEISNLRLENIQLTGGMNSQQVGLLAGASTGVIRNCSATGSIRVGEKSKYIGQLIGYNTRQISGCEATATIEAGAGSTDIGGLTGWSPPASGR